MYHGAQSRVSAASARGHEWVESRDAASKSGVAIEAWKRYRAVEGPLQSALLSRGSRRFDRGPSDLPRLTPVAGAKATSCQMMCSRPWGRRSRGPVLANLA
jgi:hypothetical protein